tara:strand:+ start:358 stop:639 length:282 start_codon:yes stop_codon:yes gene_type:complete
MDKTQNLEILPTHGPRWERNRKYYLKNTHQSLRSTLLHNIKSNGRTPSEVTIKKYKIQVEELIKNWRIYKEKVGYELSPLKKMKFEVLIVNSI